MAAVRQVIDAFDINLDFTKDFAMELPQSFFEDEPSRDRLLDIWNRDVRKAVSDIFRIKRNVLMNRYTRNAVFESAMENICTDFSRRAENINVHLLPSFAAAKGFSGRRIKNYSLRVTKLSPITDEQRNARSCVAEIPIPVQEVEAEFVGTAEISCFAGPAVSESFTGDFDGFPSGAPSSPSVEIFATNAVSVMQFEDATHDANPPLASDVVEIVEDDDLGMVSDSRDSQRSVLDRMKELESIRSLLSEAEYTTKRQAILDSI